MNDYKINDKVLWKLLVASKLINQEDLTHLHEKMLAEPNTSLADIALQNGYIDEVNLKSLKLAEYLLSTGKINPEDFNPGKKNT